MGSSGPVFLRVSRVSLHKGLNPRVPEAGQWRGIHQDLRISPENQHFLISKRYTAICMKALPTVSKLRSGFLIMAIASGAVVRAQWISVISAKNFGGPPILNEDGKPLSVSVGRVELWSKTNLINQPGPGYPGNRLVRDGFFAFGDLTIPDATAYTWTPITVKAWDSSVGETYADAVATGHGYASVESYVLPVNGTVPPYSMGDWFPGLRLLSPLPHIAMMKGTNWLQLEISGKDGQLLHLEQAPTPTGPWTSYYNILGRGRSTPLTIPLNREPLNFNSTTPARYYFRVESE